MADRETVSYVPEADLSEQLLELFTEMYLRLAGAFMQARMGLADEPMADETDTMDIRVYNRGVYDGLRLGAMTAHSVFRPGKPEELSFFLGEGEEIASEDDKPGDGDSG